MADSYYLFIVVILFFLAASDLMVGVANDAVNFLNSAVGARVAKFKTILFIAALGVLIGSTFSSGMMEIARSGIMKPAMFTFTDVMIIFLAVMVTDVILLDAFNTFGLPTSTTVSLIFELLGASVSVAILKIVSSGAEMNTLGQYINSSKALEIILGILFSVAVALIFGTLIQWIARVLFSFNYHRRYKLFGSIFAGLALSAITYFLLVKGIKGAVFFSKEQSKWVLENSGLIVTASLVIFTIIFQILHWFTKVNTLKIVILAGTFALAMAFAGNDLVNFIGVPMAGFAAYQAYTSQSDFGADELQMTALSGPVETNSLFLIIAGLIMVFTLYTNKKARTVTETEVSLGRQGEGDERFGSSPISRALVRGSRSIAGFFAKIVPPRVSNYIDRQFQRPEQTNALEDGPSFDHIRAAINLVVSSILISIGTSRKLPLSTTYVTFMVAMGSSLADRAWGRESAVYRVTGVLNVVGGWFVTAFIAFSVAFLFAMFLFYAGFIGVVVLIILALLFVLRTHLIHRRNESKKAAIKAARANVNESIEASVETSRGNVSRIVMQCVEVLELTLSGLINEDRSTLKKQVRKSRKLDEDTTLIKATLYNRLQQLDVKDRAFGPVQIELADSLRELFYTIKHLAEPSFEHVDNNHKPLRDEQETEVASISKDLGILRKCFSDYVSSESEALMLELERKSKLFERRIQDLRLKQTERIQNKEVGQRNNKLYLNILQESRNCALQLVIIARSFHALSETSRT
jgi:phosphate/sulfate permease